jgi:hypothetical protein
MAQRCLPQDIAADLVGNGNELLESMFAVQEEIKALESQIKDRKKALKRATERCVDIGLKSSGKHRLVSYRKTSWKLKEVEFKRDYPELFEDLAKVTPAQARKALDDDEEYFLVSYDHEYEVVELPESEAEDFVCEVAVR